MNNLYEIMTEAQQGGAMQTLGQKFGLSEQQVMQVVEGVLPAFSHGLKRNTSDPMSTMNFMAALASGQHEKYFDEPSQAFGQGAVSSGNSILGHLFGNKNVSRGIADQVSLSSGIGSSIIKQMLPVIAQMVLGGLFKGATGRSTRSRRRRGNPMEDMLGGALEKMIQGGLESVLGGGSSRQQRQPQSNQRSGQVSDNPLGQILEGFLGGGSGSQQQSREPDYANEDYSQFERREPHNGTDIFGEMFETGRDVDDGQRRGVESIFEQYLDGMRR